MTLVVNAVKSSLSERRNFKKYGAPCPPSPETGFLVALFARVRPVRLSAPPDRSAGSCIGPERTEVAVLGERRS
jgi:hypothetical protein